MLIKHFVGSKSGSGKKPQRDTEGSSVVVVGDHLEIRRSKGHQVAAIGILSVGEGNTVLTNVDLDLWERVLDVVVLTQVLELGFALVRTDPALNRCLTILDLRKHADTMQ